MSQDFKILKTTPLPNSEVEIEGEISPETIEKFHPDAIKKINDSLKIDGFRQGHIPPKVLIERVGDLGILEEAASLALEKFYLNIVEESKINPVGRPEVSIVKLAPKNPLVFKIKTAVVPEVSLPDYKKIGKEIGANVEKAEVTHEEFEQALLHLRKSIGASSMPGPKANEEDKEALPPELTDESVKKLGDFKDVVDFKAKFRENLKFEKEIKNKEKRRLEMIEKIIVGTKMELPQILVASEQEKMLAQFKGNISSMGLKPEDYFKQIGKTEEDIKSEWKAEAEKRAKMELILQKIALDEKIEASKEDIEKEIEHILSHHKDADPLRARIYVEQILTNEKVWQFLENQK